MARSRARVRTRAKAARRAKVAAAPKQAAAPGVVGMGRVGSSFRFNLLLALGALCLIVTYVVFVLLYKPYGSTASYTYAFCFAANAPQLAALPPCLLRNAGLQPSFYRVVLIVITGLFAQVVRLSKYGSSLSYSPTVF